MKISNNNKVNFKYDLIYVLNVCGNNLCLKIKFNTFSFKKTLYIFVFRFKISANFFIESMKSSAIKSPSKNLTFDEFSKSKFTELKAKFPSKTDKEIFGLVNK